MTQFLPQNLLALFAPRDPLPFLIPADKLPFEKKRPPYTGLAEYLRLFESPGDTPAPTRVETKDERKERKRREKAELQAYKIEQGIALWQPQNNPKATTDPYKSLFVARISFDTTESKLKREFESYGPIKKIHLIQRQDNGKPRGYAFIEYEHERDMHAAYKYADGKKIDGRRVLVDVERGRTVKGWLPRRLGGGIGNTRRAKGPGGITLDEDDEGQSRGHSRAGSEKRERRRSRSRERERERGSDRERDNKRRSRSRERTDRDKDRDRRRERDRDERDKERKRSKERDRKRSREREREPKRDKDREKDKDRNKEKERERVVIKSEPADTDGELNPGEDQNYRYNNGD